MAAMKKIAGLIAGVSDVAVFGVAIAQGNPPNPFIADTGMGAGQQSTHLTPMGETGVLAVIDQVQTAGFDQRASAPARAVASAPSRSADRPVEIIFKPTPEYTDDARSARVEGTVSLEIEFTAEGGINVLRVVHGLGYGLDEAARRAALRIRFKPAARGIDGDVLADAGHDVLKRAHRRRVIEDIIRCQQRNEGVTGDRAEPLEAPRIVAAIEHRGAEPDRKPYRNGFQPCQNGTERGLVDPRRRHHNEVESSDVLDQVVEVIAKAANTGKIGDGKIFVYDLERAIRIRTGETGVDAL